MVLESVVDLVLDPGAARPFDPVYGSGWRAWFYGFGLGLVIACLAFGAATYWKEIERSQLIAMAVGAGIASVFWGFSNRKNRGD